MKICAILSILLIGLVDSHSFAQSDIQYEMVVAKDGTGDFKSIQSAIDATKAFPDKRITIFIKKGTYKEKVRVPSWNSNLSLIGEGSENTIITWDDYFNKINRGRNSTFFTYTLLVEADDFYAENLTVRNTAGEIGQAVALHVEGNRCVFKNCKFLGNQDTVYLAGENSHLYFHKCFIEGTTDYIFGSATTLFNQCIIFSKKDSYITAASTNKEKKFGFVFLNCRIQAAPNVSAVYLGRPWRPYAKTVFLKCSLTPKIHPNGWKVWSNKDNYNTTFFAEYNNYGLGAEINERVKWSHQLSNKEARKYTFENILGDWILKYLNG